MSDIKIVYYDRGNGGFSLTSVYLWDNLKRTIWDVVSPTNVWVEGMQTGILASEGKEVSISHYYIKKDSPYLVDLLDKGIPAKEYFGDIPETEYITK